MEVKERYCSYEVAKLLKEKGFEVCCNTYYTRIGNFKHNLFQTVMHTNFACYAPTQQMACDWVFERYGISIEPMWFCFSEIKFWDCGIVSPSIGQKWVGSIKKEDYKTKEEAINIAILYVLNNFKPKYNEDNMEKYKAEKETTYVNIIDELYDTYKKKNSDYGNSFADTIEEFGFIPAVARISDKVNRMKNIVKGQRMNVKDESFRDALMDTANYCIMTIMEIGKK